MQPMFEPLENRRLMAVAIGVPMPIGIAQPPPRTTAPKQIFQGDPTLPAPDMVGTWKGKLNAKAYIWSRKVSVTLNITSQDDTTLYGSVTILGKTYTGSMDVKFKGHNFNLAFNDGDYSGGLQGFVNKKNTGMAGRGTINGFGLKASGGFLFTKAKTA